MSGAVSFSVQMLLRARSGREHWHEPGERYATVPEALGRGGALVKVWPTVVRARVRKVEQPPTHEYRGGVLVPLEVA